MNQKEAPPANYISLGPVGTIFAGLILAGVGLLMAYVIGGSSMKAGADSEYWPTVQGVVTASRVRDSGRRIHEGENRTYRPEITYAYDVESKTYTSDRLNFRLEGNSSSARPEIVEIVERYSPGTRVTVYYKPDDPSVSCLETGVQVSGFFIIGMICMAVGLLVVVSGIFAAIRKGISFVST